MGRAQLPPHVGAAQDGGGCDGAPDQRLGPADYRAHGEAQHQRDGDSGDGARAEPIEPARPVRGLGRPTGLEHQPGADRSDDRGQRQGVIGPAPAARLDDDAADRRRHQGAESDRGGGEPEHLAALALREEGDGDGDAVGAHDGRRHALQQPRRDQGLQRRRPAGHQRRGGKQRHAADEELPATQAIGQVPAGMTTAAVVSDTAMATHCTSASVEPKSAAMLGSVTVAMLCTITLRKRADEDDAEPAPLWDRARAAASGRARPLNPPRLQWAAGVQAWFEPAD